MPALDSLRTVRTVIAAGLVMVTAACTSATGTGPQASTRSRPAATATGSGGPGGAPTSTGPPLPSPPPLGAVPVRSVPECRRVDCVASAVVPNVRPGIHLVLVRGPDGDTAQTAYLLTLSAAGRPLDSRRLANGDVFFDAALPAPRCDRYVHCFVVAVVGAHGGVMNVFAVGAAGQLADVSQGGELSTDTPDLRARDLDGDGIAEVLGLENDYQPTYAEGTNYWLVWAWRGGRYAQNGCRKAQRGEHVPSGPVSPAGCPT